MYFVILMVLVSVCGRDISQNFNNEPCQERFERPFVNPLAEPNLRNRHESVNFNIQNGHVNLNQHEQLHSDSNVRRLSANPNEDHNHENLNSQRQFHETNNRETFSYDRNERNSNKNPNQGIPYGQFEPNNRDFISNDRNSRGYNVNANSGHSHVNFNEREQFNTQNNRGLSDNGYGNVKYNSEARSHDNTGSMDINMAFDRRGNLNRREQSNLNIPRQSFNINNEYSNRDVTNNRNNSMNSNRDEKYNQNVLNARKQQDEMTMDNYNKETQNNHGSPNNQSDNGLISFLNNLSNNTNQNRNQNTNRNNHRNSGFRQIDQRPKTVIENEVTEIPLGSEDKGNVTMDKDEWVWGIEETTTMSPVTLDDRAAFSGDHCPTGYARFKGMCVPED
ncbi:GATA zinc finger domain-containing protein 14-like [Cydia pomonella]|uniref:GATA zinc finger domain-containing protein 14-like n=1 Tax=Cydia pomonella TaxID=82600 RepID=UPI002ADE434A|nr:GATA zinc finger domain-containing protein 14-like [Cydia pomonella]